MSSSAIASQGTKLQIGLGDEDNDSVWTDIGDVTDISGPDTTKNQIEVTNLDSTAKEFITGLPDNGDLSFGLNYVPGADAHDELADLANASTTVGTKRWFQLVFPNDELSPKTFKFQAFVLKFAYSAQPNAALKVSAQLKITGAIEQIN